MSQLETLLLPDIHEPYEEEPSDIIAARVLERALPLSQFSPDATKIKEFRENMGVTRLRFTEAQFDDVPVMVADDLGQPSGAFKSRGASYAVMVAREARAVSAASAGNHGNGIAIAAARAGKASYVHTAATASRVKVANMRNNGAIVIDEHDNVDAAVPAARAMSEESDTAFIHPYDNLDVIAGQATVGFEMIEKLREQHANNEIDVHRDRIKIYIPIGGGGLIAGVAIAIRWAKDQGLLGEQVELHGVQMEGCDAMNRAVQKYRTGENPFEDLFEDGPLDASCDGTAVVNVGRLTLPIVADQRYVQGITIVKPSELAEAMDELSTLHGQPVEPAGALSMAGAIQDSRHAFAGDTQYVTFTSGGNVSDETRAHFETIRAARMQQQTGCAIASGRVIRRMVELASPLPNPLDPASTQQMRNYHYDSLEEQGIFLIRR